MIKASPAHIAIFNIKRFVVRTALRIDPIRIRNDAHPVDGVCSGSKVLVNLLPAPSGRNGVERVGQLVVVLVRQVGAKQTLVLAQIFGTPLRMNRHLIPPFADDPRPGIVVLLFLVLVRIASATRIG